jgi:hypothetical protein
VLLAPEHPGERLPHHIRLVSRGTFGNHGCVESIRLLPAQLDDLVEGLAVEAGVLQRS